MTHVPDEDKRKTVKNLSAVGMSQESIAAIIGITSKTLRKHYRHEYDHGNELMIADLIPVCITVATDPDHKDSVKERHFLLERKGGFIKTEKQEHTGALEITKIERTIIDPKETDG